MDPLEVNLKNLIHEGDRFITGETMTSVGIGECLKQAASAIGWSGQDEQAPKTGSMIRGKGLAVAIKSTSTPSTSAASVRFNSDGSATLLTSSCDMGQGAPTCLAQIVGDVLGF